MDAQMRDAQYHNAKGSTYLTRFLFTALPKKAYSGTNKENYDKVLELISDEIIDLMHHGVRVGDERFYPICLGVKGDQPALVKSGKFRRSFMNLGANRGCCWECLAGFQDYPFEDVASGAAWESTVGLADPWLANETSPLLRIPCQKYMPHALWKRDPFHAFKQTLGGHFAASVIILFSVDMGLFKVQGQHNDVDTLIGRAFDDFRFFIMSEWHGDGVNHTKAFTRQTLHFPENKKFPYARWKGSDQMLIIRWLRQLVLFGPVVDQFSRSGISMVVSPPQGWNRSFFEAVFLACEASITFFHDLHHEGLWLTPMVADAMANNCLKFCEQYQRLAQLSHLRGVARFHLEPCLHTFRHFSHDIHMAMGKKCSRVFSPSAQTCEMDEDFVGKIARTSRHVHAGSMSRRTIDRYLLRCKAEFESAKEIFK
eukprot:Skav209226  [mRNA]  locus=scaffold293:68270:69547:- [translate_table: standard]